MPQVYNELRRLATYRMKQENAGQTISGTVLVHEAYLRLSKEGSGAHWVNRQQFFSAAAEAMRRILIERVRAKRRVKRGGEYERVHMEEGEIAAPASSNRLLEVDAALDELAEVNPESADLVKLRLFAEFTLEEAAESTGVSLSTVKRRWAYARSWLAEHLSSNP